MEKEIELEQEAIVVYSGGGAVSSVNGYTGDVVLTTSDLENTSDYQTGTEVESAITTAIAGKQDTLTAGNNITISNNTISATDTTYSAGTGLTLNGTQFSVDTSTIATQQDVSDEATARENADINLQGQIDAISAASDVTDIVGTYAALQAYDTTHLKDNDIIKVLQDESQDDETTYYRWSTSTHTFTLIGEEGPYYTKSQTDILLQAKQDTLTAGSNITIGSDNTISATDTTYTAGTNVSISSGNVISATDTTYTAGTGLSLTGTEFSADTTVLATQTDLSSKQNTLTAGSNITISGDTISATDTTYSAFTGTDGTAAGTAGLVPAPATTDAGKFLGASGLWETAQAGGITKLTSADYNYHSSGSTDDGIAAWLLDPGTYYVGDAAKLYASTTDVWSNAEGGVLVIGDKKSSDSTPMPILYLRSDGDSFLYRTNKTTGASVASVKIGGPTVVQTTGTSQTDVMSQNAVTSMVYADPSTKQRVQLGTGANASSGSSDGVAIGYYASSTDSHGVGIGREASAYAESSVAIGYGSVASTKGVVSFKSSYTTSCYNNTAYRLLTGLYDPQSAHDAATKGYVDPTTDSSAPTTATVGRLGQIQIDTTTATAYMCVAVDTVTPAYTWKQITA